MITPLTITSMDQGKALARRQVEKLYAEPREQASQVVIAEPAAAEVVPTQVQVMRRPRRSLVAQFLSFWDRALPIGAWRL